MELPDTDDYTFSDWLSSTRRLQEVAYDSFYEKYDADERRDSMMMNLLAIHTEVDELAQEVGWKPWAEPHGWINRQQALGEIVDIMHFVGNMLTHLNATGEELTAAYKAKQHKNLQRQLEGYDGIKDKCLVCRRELQEGKCPEHG